MNIRVRTVHGTVRPKHRGNYGYEILGDSSTKKLSYNNNN